MAPKLRVLGRITVNLNEIPYYIEYMEHIIWNIWTIYNIEYMIYFKAKNNKFDSVPLGDHKIVSWQVALI